MVESENFIAYCQTLRKIQLIIEKVAKKKCPDGCGTEWDNDENSYGFYFKNNSIKNPGNANKNKYLLRFGMDCSLWRQYRDQIGGTPPKLWFGVFHDWNSAKLFSETLPEKERMVSNDSKWIMSWIPTNDWLQNDGLIQTNEVWKVLEPKVEKLLAESKRRGVDSALPKP